MTTLTLINSCQTTSCAFNHDGCAAGAITVAGTDTASCATFVDIDVRGGLESANGQVGACQHLECVNNANLLCQAESIQVSDAGGCLSYQQA